MTLVPGTYVPDVGIDYPVDNPLARLMPVQKVTEIKADVDYPFLDDSFAYKFHHNFVYFMADTLVRLLNKLKFGMRVEGREILKKYKKELSGGIVTVSNHCYRWDALCVHHAMRRRLVIPMLTDLFEGKDRYFVKYFGGIPLSDGSLSATRKFNAAFDEHHRRGACVHIFAEARSWPFYKPLRPFQKGAFTMAYRWNCPIVPLNLSFRPRTGIHKLFGAPEIPLITIKIGEPIFPDASQPRKVEVERLAKATHESICRLGGIIKNPWPAVDNND